MDPKTISRSSKILKWSLIIGIVIVLNLFYNYTLSLVYSAPEYLAFCQQKQVNLAPENQDQCVTSGGAWTELPKPVKTGEPAGYCDQTYTCNQKFQDSSKIYDRNVFITLVVLGVLTFALSLIFAGSEVISVALSIGAVLDFVVASLRYWTRADDLIKVFILGVVLAVLVWIAIKKFNVKTEGDEAKN